MLGDHSERWGCDSAALLEFELAGVDAGWGIARSEVGEEAAERFGRTAAMRLFLLGPRTFRAGAYSHWRRRVRQRSQGFPPLHCKGGQRGIGTGR